jgi:hypothetical protein
MGGSPILSSEDKAEELVRKIIAKTREGRIKWDIGATIAKASAAGLHFYFLRQGSPVPILVPQAGNPWRHFIVKDEVGKDLLKVESQGNVVAILAGLRSPVQAAVDELFAELTRTEQGKLDKAIRKLDDI